MRVTYDETEADLVCHVEGNLEQLTVTEFRESLAHAEFGHARVIFDLAAVPFVDSAGLGALVGVVRRVRERDGEAVLCSARPSVARVLDLAGLSRLVTVAEDLGAARALSSPAA